MAQVTNVHCVPGENNFAVAFSGYAQNNEFNVVGDYVRPQLYTQLLAQ